MIAKNVAFICGSVLAVAIMLTVWDEDVLNVEHLLTVMTVLGAAVAGARVFIPDENLVFCPEKTLTQVCTRMSLRICKNEIFQVIAHIHYFPLQWRGQAHTYQVPELPQSNSEIATHIVSGDDRTGPTVPLHGALPP